VSLALASFPFGYCLLIQCGEGALSLRKILEANGPPGVSAKRPAEIVALDIWGHASPVASWGACWVHAEQRPALSLAPRCRAPAKKP
jgi:hypothetical protein